MKWKCCYYSGILKCGFVKTQFGFRLYNELTSVQDNAIYGNQQLKSSCILTSSLNY